MKSTRRNNFQYEYHMKTEAIHNMNIMRKAQDGMNSQYAYHKKSTRQKEF